MYTCTDACAHSDQGVGPQEGWLGHTWKQDRVIHICVQLSNVCGADVGSKVDMHTCTDVWHLLNPFLHLLVPIECFYWEVFKGAAFHSTGLQHQESAVVKRGSIADLAGLQEALTSDSWHFDKLKHLETDLGQVLWNGVYLHGDLVAEGFFTYGFLLILQA